MKKVLWVLAVLLVLTASACVIRIRITTTVEYNVSGNSDDLTIMYTSQSRDLVTVNASAPWSTSFKLWGSRRPFLTFIRVRNRGESDVTVYILKNESTLASGTVAPNTTGDLYAVVD